MHEYECPVCHKPVKPFPANNAFYSCEGEEGKEHPTILVSGKLVKALRNEKMGKKGSGDDKIEGKSGV